MSKRVDAITRQVNNLFDDRGTCPICATRPGRCPHCGTPVGMTVQDEALVRQHFTDTMDQLASRIRKVSMVDGGPEDST